MTRKRQAKSGCGKASSAARGAAWTTFRIDSSLRHVRRIANLSMKIERGAGTKKNFCIQSRNVIENKVSGKDRFSNSG